MEAVKWLDYFYAKDGELLMQFGIEGESYVMKDGKPEYTDKVKKSPNGEPFATAVSRYCGVLINWPGQKNVDAFKQINLPFPQQQAAVEVLTKADTSIAMPNGMKSTLEESQIEAPLTVPISTFNDELFLKYIMGKEPLSNFEANIEKFKKLGIEKLLVESRQKQLDRLNEWKKNQAKK